MNRQVSGSPPSDTTPVLYDVALLSPRALADSLGAASFQTDAAVSVLAKLAMSLQRSLQSLHGNRCACCSHPPCCPVIRNPACASFLLMT